MISVISDNPELKHTTKLRELFKAEWGEIDWLNGKHNGVHIPKPLLLMESERLIGGLSFTSAVMPSSSEFGLWVNALLVLPEYRGKGLASQLIQKAQLHVKKNNVKQMFVFTEVSDLYRKQGWQIVEVKNKSSVLKITAN